MGIKISDEKVMMELRDIQNSITVTDVIACGAYSCDCTGCSNGCFESCADGNGPTD